MAQFTQFDDVAKRRIRFQTRRGLLELDLVLKRFLAKEFEQLSDEELAIFVEILDLPDPVFLAMVNQKEVSERPEFEALLAKIRAA